MFDLTYLIDTWYPDYSPFHLVLRYIHIHTGWNYHPRVAGCEFSIVDQGALCFRPGFRNRRLERFIFRCLSSGKKDGPLRNVGESICER